MRTNFLSALAIVAALTSCNNENNEDNQPISGKSTYASFSVRVKAPGTYASPATDANGVAEEQTVTAMRLFVFNGGVLETMGDVAIDEVTNIGKASLKTTTGAKMIYAVANANADMTMTVGQTLDQFKALAVGATSDVIAATGKFVMVGNVATTLVEHSEAEALTNPIAINVARAVAKAQMQYNPATVKVSNVVKGSFTEPHYQLAQCNTAMFLPREAYGLSPKGATAEQKDEDTNGTYDHLQSVKYGTPEEITAFDANYKIAASAWDFAYANSVYMAENVNEKPVTGNSTFALVRLKYTPAADIIQGTDKNLNADGTFYAVSKVDGGWDIYANKTEADAAQQAINATDAKVYDKGHCYYRLNIRDITKTNLKEKYAVLRNNFYRINITEVNSIGGNSPLDPGVIPPTPETPLETETYITADITVMAWIAVEMNEPLN